MLRLTALAFTLALAVPALAQPNRTIVDQSRSPFAIKTFVADPGSAVTAGRRAGAGTPDRIVHLAEGYNAAQEDIEAVEVTFVLFDPFGEVLGVTTEMALDVVRPEAEGRVTGETLTPDAATFHTGVVYVRRVRLAGGEVWEAPLRPVMQVLRAVDSDFDPALLAD